MALERPLFRAEWPQKMWVTGRLHGHFLCFIESMAEAMFRTGERVQ